MPNLVAIGQTPMNVIRGPKNWGAPGTAPWDTDIHTPLAEFGRSIDKRYERIYEDSRKMGPRVMPIKVTRGHRNRQRSISYLYLPIIDPL